ncbi:hypothetical protein PTKIN_Ptkin19aG0073400 [Pterospermum kingtungense]
MSWSAIWGISWAPNSSGWAFFDDWINLCQRKNCGNLWIIASVPFVGQSGLAGMTLCLTKKSVCLKMAIDLVRYRIASWFKAKYPHVCETLVDLVNNPFNCLPPSKAATGRTMVCWEKPSPGSLKFNVDGSSLGNPALSGIGGLLRDHLNRVLISFSKSIGIADSNMAEVMAVRKALVLFVTSEWVVNYPLIMECDSQNIVSWVRSPSKAP